MSGNSLVVDTNIFIYQLNGDKTIESILEGKDIFLSFVTRIELLSYRKHSTKEEELVKLLLKSAKVVHSNDSITELTIYLRKLYAIKAADAIILATALYLNLSFINADQDLFHVTEVEVTQYSV